MNEIITGDFSIKIVILVKKLGHKQTKRKGPMKNWKKPKRKCPEENNPADIWV